MRGLESVPWAMLAQPSWNAPDSVPRALNLLQRSASQADAQTAYNQVLFALGNNHAGTYFPVVLEAVPFIGAVVESGGPVACETALDVLIDLCGSFAPDPSFAALSHGGRLYDLAAELHARVCLLRPVVDAVRDRADPGSRTRALALELLDLMSDYGV